MKRFKKVASILLAVVMVLAMAVPAMAEGAPTTYTITIEDTEPNHEYHAYQVFTGRFEEVNGEKVLSDIEWGSDVNGRDILTALKSNETYGKLFADCTSAREVAKVLEKQTVDELDSPLTIVFAEIVAGHLVGEGKAAVQGSGNYTISELTAGYYLVKDTSTTVTDNDAISRYVLRVVDNLNVAPKKGVPTSEKNVKEKNDTTGAETTWQNAADYDIGDDVPFQLKATLSMKKEDFDAYETYELVFHDEQSEGLDFNEETVKVYLNGVEITNPTGEGQDPYYTVVTDGLKDNCTFEIRFPDVKKFKAEAGSVITVEYTSKLTEKAKIGSEGNPNSMSLEFSNNPNGEGTGNTPENKVIVFTFEVDIHKVQPGDTEGVVKDLNGAGFTLYKFVKGAMKDTEDKNVPADTNIDGVKGAWVKVGGEVTGGHLFEFGGQDSGIYMLVETTVPAGFNKAENVQFTIEATYDSTSEDPKLTKLVVKDKNGNVVGASPKEEGKTYTFGVDMTTGKIATDILNQKGSTLPGTGGMGTTLFYIIGGILVVGAVIVLVSKKRAAK